MSDLNERIHELKGGCVHEFQEYEMPSHKMSTEKVGYYCPKCEIKFAGRADYDSYVIPDYPNDPAATLEALIELITNGITITECQCEDGCYGVDIYFQGSCRHAPREQIPEVMWTTWCEWKEEGDEI